MIHHCSLCAKECSLRCTRCKSVWYCNSDCLKKDWKRHKPTCNDVYKANQHTLHKQEFDRIRKAYKLEDRADEISSILTSGKEVSADAFAEQFGMPVQEAIVFLEWIQVGVRFKEQSIDTAKNAGLGGNTSR